MIFDQVESQMARMRPSERRVGAFVLGAPALAASLSIADLAQAAGVSEPTVIRFCRAIGCLGVQDLKRQIARDLGRMTPKAMPDPVQNPSVSAVSEAFLAVFSLLFDLRMTWKTAQIEAFSAALAGAERVLIVDPGADLAVQTVLQEAAKAADKQLFWRNKPADEGVFDLEIHAFSDENEGFSRAKHAFFVAFTSNLDANYAHFEAPQGADKLQIRLVLTVFYAALAQLLRDLAQND